MQYYAISVYFIIFRWFIILFLWIKVTFIMRCVIINDTFFLSFIQQIPFYYIHFSKE